MYRREPETAGSAPLAPCACCQRLWPQRLLWSLASPVRVQSAAMLADHSPYKLCPTTGYAMRQGQEKLRVREALTLPVTNRPADTLQKKACSAAPLSIQTCSTGMVYPWSFFFGCAILRRTICILILGFRPIGDSRMKNYTTFGGVLYRVSPRCSRLNLQGAIHTLASRRLDWNLADGTYSVLLRNSGIFPVDHIPVASEC